jgi:glycosyltransferase involved in cell wall biosynthesis
MELLRYVKCNPEKIRVIHDPVSNAFKPFQKSFNRQKPVILQVGTSKNKNVPHVAEALKGIPCHLRVIGKIANQNMDALTACGIEYSSASNISSEELVNEYQHCDMLVFVSTYEGFGLPIIEANATGRPVVTSNILSMPEVAGDAACLVNPFDVSSIRTGILRVIQDESYREELIKYGFKNVERFRPDAIAHQYMELYSELFSKSHNFLRS